MEIVQLLYGNQNLEFSLPLSPRHEVLLPHAIPDNNLDPVEQVKEALHSPLCGCNDFERINSSTRVSISINDKTRPVPNDLLLGCLLEELHNRGVAENNITLFIASGTHLPMQPEEFHLVLNDKFTSRYKIQVHDCDDTGNLVNLGMTNNGTPVFINQKFYESDLKIVVGDIELHHFAGYSGGVKSAAIGLAGRTTINTNHTLLLSQGAIVAEYDANPLRMDIEEIGAMAEVHLALNAVLSEDKKVLHAFFGHPRDVMRAGIKAVNSISQVPIREKFDVVIASAGGYPKDINLYQSQKAMTHASLFCKPGGKIILVAECREGAGSAGYLQFMQGVRSVNEVMDKFQKTGFTVGPHKAFQIARLLEDFDIYLLSAIPAELVRSLLLKPLEVSANAIQQMILQEPVQSRIALLPFATACIPKME